MLKNKQERERERRVDMHVRNRNFQGNAPPGTYAPPPTSSSYGHQNRSGGENNTKVALSCSDLYPRTKKISYEISFALDELEAKRVPGDDAQRALTADLARLYDNLHSLDNAVKREIKNKGIWTKRVQDLWGQYNSYSSSLQKLMDTWNRRAQAHNERQQLFDYSENIRNRDATSNMLSANEHLQSSIDMIDDMTDHSGAVKTMLKEQGARFKKLRKSVLSMLSTLGLSNSVIRVIQQREWTDSFLIFGCMIFTLFFWWLCRYIFSS